MLLLRSLRARLLIIGIVPVLVALVVTAVMTVRSVNQFSDHQRYEARMQQERDLKRLTTGLSREYAPLIGGLFKGKKNDVLRSVHLESAYGSSLYFIATNSSATVNATGLDLKALTWTRPLPKTIAERLDQGQAVVIPTEYMPAGLRDEVVVARGLFPAEQIGSVGAIFGLLVIARPAVQVSSPAGTLRRALIPAFAVGTAVAIILALVLGLRLVRPLRRLAAAARAVARGDDDVQSRVLRHDGEADGGSRYRTPLPDARLARVAHTVDGDSWPGRCAG